MIGDSSPNIEIYMPYLMGCDSAGGDWNIMNAIIENTIDIVLIIGFDANGQRRIKTLHWKDYKKEDLH